MTAIVETPSIVLREEDHTYWLGDEQIPGVTTVISEVGLVNYEWSSQFAMDRGSEVHKAIHYYLEGDLDIETLHPMYRGYLDAALRAIDALGVDVVAVEQKVFHPIYRYAGTADLIATRGVGELYIIDWKTAFNPPKATALQVHAYAEAWKETTRTPVHHRISVGLHQEGKFRIHNYDEVPWAFDHFLAALSLWNLRKEYL